MNKPSMIPQYATTLFTDIWDNVASFKEDFADTPLAGTDDNPTLSDANLTTLFYLLYARYGNNPIANNDIEQWKFKVFSIIFQYGPTWQKRLDIQAKLRGLGDEDVKVGAKSIYNHALNPSTQPSTGSTQELNYINEQNTSHYKRSLMDGYTELWSLLRTDITEDFLNQFKKCFKVFVSSERPLLFITDTSEEEEE